MRHNQILTKAAMQVLSELIEEKADLQKKLKDNEELTLSDEYGIASWMMKIKIIDTAIVSIKNQIIEGDFNI